MPYPMIIALCLLFPTLSSANSNYRGYLESDLRLSLPGQDVPGNSDSIQIHRLENSANFSGLLSRGDVHARFNLRAVYYGSPQVSQFIDLTQRQKVDAYRIESDALSVEITDMFFPGVDLIVGRQILDWGSADQFNPANPVNSLDLEDPIKFGDRVANEMVLLTWNIPWFIETEESVILEDMSLSLVWVPMFRPGLIPQSSLAIFQDPKLLAQQAGSESLSQMTGLLDAFNTAGGSVTYDVAVDRPTVDAKSSQYGAHLEMTLLGIDFGASYYRGYSDIVYATTVVPDIQGPDSVLSGLALLEGASLETVAALANTVISQMDLAGTTVSNHVTLTYPKIQMAGADFSTSLDFLGGLGLWVEAAVFFHDNLDLLVDVSFIDQQINETPVEAGQYVKVVAGMDYTITSWWYMNLQYMHGFVDEFGRDNLNDYILAVTDLKFLGDTLLTRLSAILQIQDKSALLYPNFVSTAFSNTELSLGALIYLGEANTKFGSPATGGNFIFARGRYSF